MRRLSLMAFYAALAVAISACQQGGKVSLENPHGNSPAPIFDGAEFSSMSAISKSTGNYTAEHSLGDSWGSIKQTSTTNGYKLFSSVQGVQSSE
jgi:hypothetical protein